MILDSQTQFSNSQTLSATGSTDSTNFIDLSAPRDIGSGKDVKWYVDVTTTLAQTGTGTVTANLVADTSPTFANNPTVIGTTGPVAVASLTAAGPALYGYVNFDPYAGERYLKMQYVVNGTTLTAGALSSGLVINAQADEYYPSGINVSGV